VRVTAALVVVALFAAGYGLSGRAAAWLGVDPPLLQTTSISFYCAAVALAAAEVVPYIWRVPNSWPVATAVSMRGIGIALALFGLLRALPYLGPIPTPVPLLSDVLASLGRYTQPLRALSFAVLAAGITVSLYRGSFPFWRPIPPRTAVEAFVIALLARYLADPLGPVTVRTGLDVSYFAWPVWVAAAGYTAFWAVRLARLSRPFQMSAALAAWAGLSVAAYLAFRCVDSLAVELVLSPRFQELGERAIPYLSVVAGVDRWAAAGIAVFGLERSTAGYTARWHQRRLGPLVRAARSVALGVVAWGIAQQLRPLGPPATVAGLVAFSAFAAVAAGQAARLLAARAPDGPLAGAVSWLAGSAFRNANIGGLAALYASVVKPAMYEATAHAPLIEMLGLALPAAYLIARASGGIAARTPDPPAPLAWRDWRMHRQNASPLPDSPLRRAAAMREGYVESGESAGLAVRVTTAMTDAGRPVDEIVRAVRPIVFPGATRGRPRGLIGWPTRGAGDGTRAGGNRASRLLAADAMEAAIAASAGSPVPGGATGKDPDAVWREARRTFVEQGDRVWLGVAATVLAWGPGVNREVLTTRFGRIVQYRDAKPRWYDLPSARKRMVEDVPLARGGFADALRPQPSQAGRSQ
jgi:hypothetical protein